MAGESASSSNIDFRTKISYGVSSVANGIKLQFLGMLLFFYNQIVGLPAPMVSSALAISLTIDALWDPVIGQASDGLRTPWGRRHPLLYGSVIPVGIAFALLWNPPAGMSHHETFLYLLSMIMLVRLTTSFYEVPNQALVPELAPEYHDRTNLLTYRYMFQAIGTALSATLCFKVFLRDTPAYPRGQMNPDGWGPLGLTLAFVVAGSVLLGALGTHHRIPSLHKPAARKFDLSATLKDIAATLNNWNFGVAVVAGIMFGVTQGMVGGLSIYFATYFWELPARDVWVLVMLGLASTPIAAYIAPRVSRRWGKRSACMTLMFANVVVSGLPILLRLLDFFPANGTPWILPILTFDSILSGVLKTSGFIIVSSMIADITEEAQVKTGRRSEGLLVSADSILNKTANSLAALIPGLLLAFVGFPEKAHPGAVDPQVLHRLGWVYLPLTFAMSTLSILTWSFFRIDKTQHDRNLATVREAAALAEQRAEALDVSPAPASRP